MGKLCAATNTLNRNLEASIAVGSQFDSVSELWKQFEDSLRGSIQTNSASDDPSLEGISPGGGDTMQALPASETKWPCQVRAFHLLRTCSWEALFSCARRHRYQMPWKYEKPLHNSEGRPLRAIRTHNKHMQPITTGTALLYRSVKLFTRNEWLTCSRSSEHRNFDLGLDLLYQKSKFKTYSRAPKPWKFIPKEEVST